MQNIQDLVDATIRVKGQSASHVGWPLAAIKAIQGKGITHKPDVDRLKKSVLASLRQRELAARSRSNTNAER